MTIDVQGLWVTTQRRIVPKQPGRPPLMTIGKKGVAGEKRREFVQQANHVARRQRRHLLVDGT